MALTARYFQNDAAQAALKDFEAGFHSVVVNLPTGTGKTVLFSLFPEVFGIGKRRMMILVGREELADQAAAKVAAWNPGYTVGVEMAGRSAGEAQIVVASVPTLATGRIKNFKADDFAIVVTDECHHATATTYGEVYRYLGVGVRTDIVHVGVTATTQRGDGKGLGKVYQKISYRMTMAQAIKEGWLCNLRGKRVTSSSVNLDNVDTTSEGDLNLAQLDHEVNTPASNALILKAYQQYGEDRKFLGFAASVDHAKNLAQLFRKGGLAVEAVWGLDPDRQQKLADHRAGKLQGLFNFEILTEGYDDWSIGCIIMARFTQSESKYIQMLGRGARIEDGIGNLVEALALGVMTSKLDCLVLDIVGLSKRHSLCTMASLFGFGPNTDLKGRPITELIDELEEVQATKPFLSMYGLDDVDDLKAYVENADLFVAQASPDVVQFSEYKWLKTDSGNYVLQLRGGEMIFALDNWVGGWNLSGSVRGCFLEGSFNSLEEVIREGDHKVRALGGKMFSAVAKSGLKGDSDPAKSYQISRIEAMGLTPPPGLTSGQARAFIAKVAASKAYKIKNGVKV